MHLKSSTTKSYHGYYIVKQRQGNFIYIFIHKADSKSFTLKHTFSKMKNNTIDKKRKCNVFKI